MIDPRDPVRLSQMPPGPEARAGRCLSRARVAGSWSLERRAAAYWKVQARIAEERPLPGTWRRAGAAGLAAALAIAAGASLAPDRQGAKRATAASGVAEAAGADLRPGLHAWSRIDLAEIGMVELSPEAELDLRDLPHERQLRIANGTLRAQVLRQDPLRPVVVLTPHLRVVVLGTRFDVRAEATATQVLVLEGAVRAEALAAASGGKVVVSGGEAIDSSDPRLAPPAAALAPRARVAAAGLSRAWPGSPPSPAPRPRRSGSAAPRAEEAGWKPLASDCGLLSPGERKACLLRQSQGRGLGAENALLALGLHVRDVDEEPDRAVELFRDYQARFPDGALAPEVGLALLETLQEQGRLREAVAAAAAFEERFADDSRAEEVALVRAGLLCAVPGGREQALQLYQRLERGAGSAELRERAARAHARCREAAPPSLPPWEPPPTPAG